MNLLLILCAPFLGAFAAGQGVSRLRRSRRAAAPAGAEPAAPAAFPARPRPFLLGGAFALLVASLVLEPEHFWLGRPTAFLLAVAASALPIAVVRRSRARLLAGLSVLLALVLFAGAFVAALDRYVRRGLGIALTEDPVALIEARPTTLKERFTREMGPGKVEVREGSAAVEVRLRLREEGGFGEGRSFTLPGEKWGIGGEKFDLRDAWSVVGRRSFCVLTTLDVKYRDPEIPTARARLGPVDREEIEARFRRQIPLLRVQLQRIFGTPVSTSYEQVVYQSASAGPFWAVYFRDREGFVPVPVPEDRFKALGER